MNGAGLQESPENAFVPQPGSGTGWQWPRKSLIASQVTENLQLTPYHPVKTGKFLHPRTFLE